MLKFRYVIYLLGFLLCAGASLRLVAIRNSEPADQTNYANPLGKVTESQNDTRMKKKHSLVFRPLKKKRPVYNHDTIYSGENSRVLIQFNDRTEIELLSNSLIEIAELKTNNPGLFFKIDSDRRKKLRRSLKAPIKINVLSGGAKVKSNGVTRNVNVFESVEIGSENLEVQKSPDENYELESRLDKLSQQLSDEVVKGLSAAVAASLTSEKSEHLANQPAEESQIPLADPTGLKTEAPAALSPSPQVALLESPAPEKESSENRALEPTEPKRKHRDSLEKRTVESKPEPSVSDDNPMPETKETTESKSKPETEPKLERSPAALADIETYPETITQGFQNWWVWLSSGANFTSVDHSVSQVNLKFESFEAPSLFFEVGKNWTDRFHTTVAYTYTPGSINNESNGQNIPFEWQAIDVSASYSAHRSSDGRHEWVITTGLENHSYPLLEIDDSNQVELNDMNVFLATAGFSYSYHLSPLWKLSYQQKLLYPVYKTITRGDLSLSAPLMFDGAIGSIFRLFEHTWVGAYWYGQWHQFNYEISGTETASGSHRILYSNVELRLGVDF